MKRKVTSDTKNHGDISATLLVPLKYRKFIDSKKLRFHFKRLIQRYLIVVEKGMVVNSKKITIRYQEPDQDLQKIPFHPDPEDWAIFKVVASANGTSMTGLFTFLLECELFEQEYDSEMQNCNNGNLQLDKGTPRTTPKSIGTPMLKRLRLECGLLFKGQVQKYEKVFVALRN